MSEYDTDILLWSERQADLLRRVAAGELANSNEIDWQNVIDEVLSVGRSERHALQSQLAIAIVHLCKLRASPARDPRAGWLDSILNARAEIERLLENSPSLRPKLPDVMAKEMPRAKKLVRQALAAHGEKPIVDIDGLMFTDDEVIGDWLPEPPTDDI